MNNLLIFITVASLALAATMGVVAWRALRSERRRSEARITALAAEIGDDESFPAQPMPGLQAAHLFDTARETNGRSRMPIAIAAGALVVGTVVTLAIVIPTTLGRTAPPADPARRAAPVAVETANAVRPAPQSAPIELIALGHERSADRLTVRGTVRNPANGLDVTHLTAVVLLFNSAGTFVATGRAAIDATDLLPGAQSPFVVRVPGATDVGRYRVSFRTDDDHVVPHVDRRDGA